MIDRQLPKRLEVLIVWILCIMTGSAHAYLANYNKRGLYVKSIDDVRALSDHEIDLATAALIVSEQWSDVVHGLRYRSKLDDMAQEIKNRLRERSLRADHRAIPVINEYLFEELGFKAVSEPNDPNDLFLHSVIDNREGYCLSLSILYLSIGERLGLPLHGVVVPGHFFVRYQSSSQQFNIETTAKGVSLSDEHYMTEHNVPKGSTHRLYMKSLDKKQTLGCLFNNFGVVYLETGLPKLAILALDTSARINPMLSEARSNLGIVLMQEGHAEDALVQLKYALEINPNDAAVRRELGRAYLRTKKYRQAVEELTRSIEIDPNGVEPYILLAEVYSLREQYRLAREALETALLRHADNARLNAALARISQKNRNYERALLYYRRALDLKPDLLEAHFGTAICNQELGRSDQEIGAYKNMLRIAPNSYDASFNLAQAYARQDMFDMAQQYYLRAIEINPSDAIAHCNLAISYSKTSQTEQAISHFNKAIALDTKMGVAHHNIAVAYYNKGKYRDAWHHIQKAHQLGVDVSQEVLDAVAERAGVAIP
ncbi:tetratricopeptide repeat protein [Planctomycetota bacterium]